MQYAKSPYCEKAECFENRRLIVQGYSIYLFIRIKVVGLYR